VNSAPIRRRIERMATVAVAATSMALSGALLASPALADEEHAFTLDIKDPAPVAPGADGVITYTLTNTSDEATDGFQIRVSAPKTVSLDFGGTRCDKRATSAGTTCYVTGEMGTFAPGETKVLEKSYSVAADAPQSANLGKVEARVVPIVDGKPTEDLTDSDGPHVDNAQITTSAGPAEPGAS
jgi:hypothetical protein